MSDPQKVIPFSPFERDLPFALKRFAAEKQAIKGILILFEYKDGSTDAQSVGLPDIRLLIGEMSGVEHRFWRAVRDLHESEETE